MSAQIFADGDVYVSPESMPADSESVTVHASEDASLAVIIEGDSVLVALDESDQKLATLRMPRGLWEQFLEQAVRLR